MPKVIEKDNKKLIIIEREYDVQQLDLQLKAIGSQIKNIDRNIKGLQQRKEFLQAQYNELTDIKKAGPIVPAPVPEPEKL